MGLEKRALTPALKAPIQQAPTPQKTPQTTKQTSYSTPPVTPFSASYQRKTSTAPVSNTTMDPTSSTSSVIAREGTMPGDPQQIQGTSTTTQTDRSVGLGLKKLGIHREGNTTQTQSDFSTNPKYPARPSHYSFDDLVGGGGPHMLAPSHGRTFQTEHETGNSYGATVGGGKIKNPAGKNMPTKNVPVPTHSIANYGTMTGQGRETSVHRPDDGVAANNFNVTTSSYDINRQEVGNVVTGSLNTETRKGTSHTYDFDPKNEKAAAALQEYNRTGLQPGARELTGVGDKKQRALATHNLSEFDRARSDLAYAQRVGPVGYADVGGPGASNLGVGGQLLPRGGGMLRSVARHQAVVADAQRRLQTSRSALNQRWGQQYSLSQNPENGGKIMPGLTMKREEQFRNVSQTRDAFWRSAETKTAKSGTSWVRMPNGTVRQRGFGTTE